MKRRAAAAAAIAAAVAAAIAAVALGVGFGWRPQAPPPLQAAAAAPAPPMAPPPGASAAAPPPLRAAFARPASAPLAAPAAAAPVWDICGIGRVPVPPGTPARGPVPADALLLPALLAAAPRIVQTLAAGSARQRGAGLLLAATFGDDHAQRLAAARELQALAAQARDPVLSSWVALACDDEDDAVACRQRAVRQWRQHDPGNLAAAAAMLESQNAAARQADALAALPFWRTHAGELGALWQAAVAADTPDSLREVVASVGAAMDQTRQDHLLPLLFACIHRGPHEAACAHVAERLVAAPELASLGAGIDLGRIAGWPADRMAALQADFDRLRAADAEFGRDDDRWSCRGVERRAALRREVARHGEVGALRQASGR